MNSNYYIPQAGYIQNIIHSCWQVEGLARFKKELIIPKGVVEIIFNFSDQTAIAASWESRRYSLSRCFINGFNTSPVELELPGHLHFFGVRLLPLAIKKILGAPAAEFLDIPVDLTLVDNSFGSLWHELAEENNFHRRVEIFGRWIERKTFDWYPQEQLMNQFLCEVNQHDLSPGNLAGVMCYSPRHLSRKIFEATGMNTEEVLHYKKYLHALHLIHHSNLSLTEIAYQSNFADQSHFIRSFRQYANMTPGAFKRNECHQKGHFYQDVR